MQLDDDAPFLGILIGAIAVILVYGVLLSLFGGN